MSPLAYGPPAYETIETEAASVPTAKKRNVLVAKKASLLHNFERAFLRLGEFIFDNAKYFISCSFAVVLLCAMALLFIRFETRADLLYALPASQARSDLAKQVTLYGVPPRVNMVFVVSRDGEMVMTPSVLRKMKKLDDYIKNDLKIPPLRSYKMPHKEHIPIAPYQLNYQEVCYRNSLPKVDFSAVENLEYDYMDKRRQLLPNGRRRLLPQSDEALPRTTDRSTPCHSMGPLDLYRNEKQFGTPLATRSWPYVPNLQHNKIVKADLALTDPQVVHLSSGTARLMNATGFLFIYHTISEKGELAASLEWEAALIDFINHDIKPYAAMDMIDPSRFRQLRKEKELYDSTHLTFEERQATDPTLTKFDDTDWSKYQVFVNAQRSWQDELGRSTSLDSRLMRDYCLAYLIIATYMIIVNRTNNIVSSKSICGWIGSLSALFGFCVGGGICYWLGLRHTPTMHASPFLVLAIGLDNTFVVLNFYTLAHSYRSSPRERCAMSLSNAGISITITTFTSIISFLVGAAGPYLAVRNFCYVTAMGLLGGYIMNIVFFFPFLCLESVAEAEGKPLFLPLPPRLQKWLLGKSHVKFDAHAPQSSSFVEMSLSAGDKMLSTDKMASADPFDSKQFAHSQPVTKLAATMPSYAKQGITPPTSPRTNTQNALYAPPPTLGAGLAQHGHTHRIGHLYRHRQVMAGFKTGSSSRNSDVFASEPTSSGPSSSNQTWDAQQATIFREDLLRGRNIYELASIRWRFSRRYRDIKKEMLRRQLLDQKTGKLTTQNRFMSPEALCELHDKGHQHVLYTLPATIPDVVLPAVYQVAKATAVMSDEPDGTVGKVSRGVFLHRIGPALLRRRVCLLMMFGLCVYIGVSIYGALKYLSAGLDLENLTPPDSYLREAFQLSHDKFPIFPYETNLYFTAPDVAILEGASLAEKRALLADYGSNGYGTRRASDLKPLEAGDISAHGGSGAGMAQDMEAYWDSLGEVQWWEPQSVVSYIEIDKRLRQMKTTQDVLNGLLLFYNENAQRLFGNASMPAEDRRLVFHAQLYRWLKSGVVGQHVRDQFRFADPDPADPQGLPRLMGVRLIIFNFNFLNSFEQSRYMVEIRRACQDVSRNWNEFVLNGTSIPRGLQNKVQESSLNSKKAISDPVFNLPRAPSPVYPTIPKEVEQPSDLPAGFTATPFMETFLFFESDITILRSTIVNMSTAFVAIVLVSSLLMRGFGTAALVTVMICLVDLGIVGFMGIWGIQLNILSMILLVLSIGFSVDYTVHVVHTFTHCLGRTRKDKMAETLVLMCNPVTHGAISTFLGVLPIAFRREFVMETFFKMTLLVVAFGFLNGVIFLPVILGFKGPVFNSTRKEAAKLTDEVEAATKSLFRLRAQP